MRKESLWGGLQMQEEPGVVPVLKESLWGSLQVLTETGSH